MCACVCVHVHVFVSACIEAPCGSLRHSAVMDSEFVASSIFAGNRKKAAGFMWSPLKRAPSLSLRQVADPNFRSLEFDNE